jgi:hypothetical protein
MRGNQRWTTDEYVVSIAALLPALVPPPETVLVVVTNGIVILLCGRWWQRWGRRDKHEAVVAEIHVGISVGCHCQPLGVRNELCGADGEIQCLDPKCVMMGREDTTVVSEVKFWIVGVA